MSSSHTRTPSAPWARRAGAALVAAALVPAVVAVAATTSLGDRADSARALPAAVVNLDEPVTSGEGKDASTIAAGRLLAAGLTRPDDDTTAGMDWELTNAAHAREGLADGTYHAVVTIPKKFSATVARISTDTPQQAGVEVRTDGADATVVGTITTDVTTAAADHLGRVVTTTYLTSMFDATTQIGDSLSEAADGAGDLSDGAGQLSDGISALNGGAAELSTGAHTAADGASELSTGAGDLDAGASDLASGAGALKKGTRQLASGLGDLSTGADELSTGAGTLSTGATTLSEGVVAADDGAQALATGLGTLKDGTADLSTQTDDLATGAEQVSTGVAGWAQVLRGWGQACQVPALASAAAELCAGTALALGPDGSTADALVSGSSSLATGARELADAAPTLRQGIVDAEDGAGKLAEGTTALRTGASELATGATSLASGADTLATGAQNAKGAATKVKKGSSTLADGAGTLSDGTSKLATGSRDLADGTRTLADGSTTLADGAGGLEDGAGQVVDGSSTLAERLTEGADQVPQLDADQRRANAEAIARPVVAEARDDAPTTGRSSTAPTAAVLAIWLGAFGMFLAVPALDRGRLATAGTASRTVLASLAPALAVGVAQVALVVAAVHLAGVDAAKPWFLALLAAPVAAFAFLTAAQAVMAWCGERLGGVVLVALTAVQALTLPGFLPLDAAPGWVSGLNGLLPVPLAAEVWEHAVHGTGSAPPVLGLLLWALAALALSVAAASRRSRVGVADVRRAVTAPA